MTTKIKLGYEVESGKKVDIKLSHMIVTGITQLSGKTTTLNGLIARSGRKAIIFKTKRGEKGITEGTIIPPFFKEKFDWEEAKSILEASQKTKLKFETSWIIDYSKGANSLFEFKKNIDNALSTGATPIGKKMNDITRGVLITLQAYLEKILPELQYAPFSRTLEVRDGINVMDLENFKPETQMLIVKSVLMEVLENFTDITIIMPECWLFIPQDYSNPCKRATEEFIRQGATNGNYLWMDAQDLRGVEKLILRQVSTWIMGLQQQKDEVENTIKQMPLPKRSLPDTSEIMTLKIGHFIVCTPEFVKRVYVQPSWLSDGDAEAIATGEKKVDDVKPEQKLVPFSRLPHEIPQLPALPAQGKDFTKDINEVRTDFFNKIYDIQESVRKLGEEIYLLKMQKPAIDIDGIVPLVLQKMPMQAATQPTINIDAIVSQCIAKMPKMTGATVYEVAPLEKLKRDFLEEAKKRILDSIGNLDDEQKKMLKYIEIQGIGLKLGNLIEKCLFKSQTSGGTRDAARTKLKGMVDSELVRYDSDHTLYYKNLDALVMKYCEQHGITEQEKKSLLDHIFMEMLK